MSNHQAEGSRPIKLESEKKQPRDRTKKYETWQDKVRGSFNTKKMTTARAAHRASLKVLGREWW